MTRLQNSSIIYKDNQGKIFLANNRQVGICTKHIDIRYHFLWEILEDKDIDINYIQSEDNPEYIRENNTQKECLSTHKIGITDGEILELVDTGRENVKKTGVTDDLITYYKIEYSSHALAEVVDGKHKDNCILIMRSRTGNR